MYGSYRVCVKDSMGKNVWKVWRRVYGKESVWESVGERGKEEDVDTR